MIKKKNSNLKIVITSIFKKPFFLFCLSLIILLPNFSTAATIHSPSCSQSDIESLLNTINDGDTLVIPAGECAWSSQIMLPGDKSFTLQGAGIDQTIITQFGLRHVGDNKCMRITGFTFKDMGNAVVLQGTCPEFRVHHNKFENLNGKAMIIDGFRGPAGPLHGLIDNNIITGDAIFSGIIVSGHNFDSWDEPLTLGTANAVYFEDNLFDFPENQQINEGIPVLDSNMGARLVFRYNTVNNIVIANHGACANDINHLGTHSWEFYGNDFNIVGDQVYRLLNLRSGTGVIFDNTITTSNGGYVNMVMGFTNYRTCYTAGAHCSPTWDRCDGDSQWDGNLDSTGYPCLNQMGRTSDMDQDGVEDYAPIYEWNNLLDQVEQDPKLHTFGCSGPAVSDHIQEGRDYITNTQMPGYTPYTYPHPFRGSSPPATCGDNNIDFPEQCEGSNLNGQSCSTQGFNSGTLNCFPPGHADECQLDTSSCTTIQTCGNSQIDSGEQCDGTNLNSQSCTTQGFDSGTLNCHPQGHANECQFNTASCTTNQPTCGNSQLDPGEACDTGNLNSQTCATQGFNSGTLTCYPQGHANECQFNTASCSNNPPSGQIFSPDRIIDWNPGIPGGIPQRTTICTDVTQHGATPDDATDDTSAFQAAINACPEGQVVFIPAGNYFVSSLTINKGIVLRGENPQTTSLTGTRFTVGTWSFGSPIDITSGYTKDSTTLTLSSTSGLAVGDLIIIDQLNSGSITHIGTGTCSWCSRESGGRVLGQMNLITAINGNTITIDKGMHHTYSSSLQPQIQKHTTPTQFAGIENIHLLDPEFRGINMQGCVYCWIKNIISENIQDEVHIRIGNSFGVEVRENHIHRSVLIGGGEGYGILLGYATSSTLVEDNILNDLHGNIYMSWGASGNVIAYNYLIDSEHSNPNVLSPNLNEHGGHPHMNLYEGNYLQKYTADQYWGSGSHNTLFRNRILGYKSNKPAAQTAISIEKNLHYMNVVGNLLGTQGQSVRYQFENEIWGYYDVPAIYRLGYESDGDGNPSGNDPQVLATLLRHGNFDYVNNQVIWDSSIQNQNIPNSLYLNSKPAFFGNLQWPPFGPSGAMADNQIPAQVRYNGGSVCIALVDVLNTINQWKQNQITLPQVLQTISQWKSGC